MKKVKWLSHCLQQVRNPKPVLRIRDAYPGRRIRIFSIPDSGSASKNWGILTQKIVSKLSEIWSGLFIPDPAPDFLPIPDPVFHYRGQKGTGPPIRNNVQNCPSFGFLS